MACREKEYVCIVRKSEIMLETVKGEKGPNKVCAVISYDLAKLQNSWSSHKPSLASCENKKI